MIRSLVFWRWLLALVSTYFCVRETRKALTSGGPTAAVLLLVAVGALIAAVLLISKETIEPIAEYCGRPFANLIFPNAKFSKPALSYILARSYSKQMRYAEAISEYEKIINNYPREKVAYLELISVCGLSGEEELAHLWKTRFRKRFRRES